MKKKILVIMLLMLVVFYAPGVLAQSISGCTAIKGLENLSIDPKIPNMVHIVIVVIKIAVPILLVIFGMLDLFKGLTAQKEDEIKKGQQIFVKRLIAAAIIFFVVSIVQLLVSFVSNDEPGIMQCANCFINGVDKNGNCK